MELRMLVVNSLFSDLASKITEVGHSKAEADDCVQRHTVVLEPLVIVGHLMPSCTVFLAKVGFKACTLVRRIVRYVRNPEARQRAHTRHIEDIVYCTGLTKREVKERVSKKQRLAAAAEATEADS